MSFRTVRFELGMRLAIVPVIAVASCNGTSLPAVLCGSVMSRCMEGCVWLQGGRFAVCVCACVCVCARMCARVCVTYVHYIPCTWLLNAAAQLLV